MTGAPVESRPRPDRIAGSSLAREVLALLRRALPSGSQLDLALASDAAPERSTAARVVVHSPGALGRLLWPPSPDAFGEAYLRGDIDMEGDIWTAVDAGRSFELRRLGRDLPRLAGLALRLRRGAAPAPALHRRARLSGRRHSRPRDLAAVRFHYDVGNEFFGLWLDRRLVYSCAYFESPDMTIDAAQEAKLDLICRKLRLEPGARLLDIGCGWGSLVMFAAERYEAEATGITLSAVQADWATEEVRKQGLGTRARVSSRTIATSPALVSSTRSRLWACSSTLGANSSASTSPLRSVLSGPAASS